MREYPVAVIGAGRRGWQASALASFVALLIVALCARTTFRRPNAVLAVPGERGSARAVDLPYKENAPVTRPMEFALHLRAGALTPRAFLFIPDDRLLSIAVNGRVLSLAGIEPRQLNDYNAGFSFPLGRELAAGDNVVVVRVQNTGGPGGLEVHPDPERGLAALELGAAAFASLVFLAAVMRGLGCSVASIVLAGTAIALRLAYLWVTRYTTRAHDADEHLAYVQYLLDHHALPKASEGYAFYHPPLYYLVSALVRAALADLGFGLRESVIALQLESVLFDLGFVAFAAMTARLWLDRIPAGDLGRRLWSRRGLLLLCSTLVALWPTCILHAVRVGNDDLIYLCFGGAMYFASRWWLSGGDGERKDFYFAAGWAALGMITKSNSLIVFFMLGTLLVARLVRTRERRPAFLLAYALPLAVLFAVSSGIALHEAIVATLSGKQDVLLVANAHSNSSKLAVGNRAENYLWFDLGTFVPAAFIAGWEDGTGRQYFWNYLVKTSLFGQWTFDGPWAWNLAVVLSILCLAMGLVVAAGALLRPARDGYAALPLWALAVFLVGSLVLIRMRIPNSCTGDFRYVLPVLLPLSLGYVEALIDFRRRGWTRLAWAGLGLGWLFCALSAMFVAAVFLSAR